VSSLIDSKYEIVGKLGAGAMGEVLEARHTTTGRRVAIKVINAELAADDSLVVRFQREARAAGTVESRHIAQVFDAGKDATSGSPYLVMELLEGADLATLLDELGALRPELAARVVAQALAGLERAHGANIVHRDIKPANIYVARSDAGQRVVKIVDFGIAKVKDDLTASRSHALTQTSTILGSPLYMSPEQAKQSRSVDARADLWSIGIVLYQLLTGDPPHAYASSLTELLLAICTEQVKSVQLAAPWVPADIANVVDRALRLDPAMRYGSATEMLADLAQIVPDWQLLNDQMLTPMSAEERAAVAPKSTDLPDVGVSTGGAAGPVSLSESSAERARSSASASQAGATVFASAGSAPGLSASQSMAGSGAPRTRRMLPLVMLAGVALGGIGLVGAAILHSGRDAAPPAGLVGPATDLVPTPSASAEPSATPPILVPLGAGASASASSSASAGAEPSAEPSAKGRPKPVSAPTPKTTTTPPPTATHVATKPTATAPAKPPPSSASPISRDFN
jgi:serine/threonine protein kinase